MNPRQSSRAVALALAAAVTISGGSAAGQPGERSGAATGPLIDTITPDEMHDLLTNAGYSIAERGRDYLLIISLNDQMMLVQMFGCEDGDSDEVRVQAR